MEEIPPHDEDIPWGFDWTPEFSRRARGVPVYAALRSMGRAGIANIIDSSCEHAERIANRLAQADGVEVLNDVVLNQVLVRFDDDDQATNAVIERAQEDGTCWLSGSSFGGRAVMRVSVVGWQTTADDIDRSADAILEAAQAVASGLRDADRLKQWRGAWSLPRGWSSGGGACSPLSLPAHCDSGGRPPPVRPGPRHHPSRVESRAAGLVEVSAGAVVTTVVTI